MCSVANGYYSSGGQCLSCNTTNSKITSYCLSCTINFFNDGYLCYNGSAPSLNYNTTIGSCDTGYAYKKNVLTNETIGCICSSAAGNYLNSTACLPCSTGKPSNVTVAQCTSCTLANGFFLSVVECIYCPSIAGATGAVANYGCVCSVGWFWDTIYDTCDCDYFNGYISLGVSGVCFNCSTVAHTYNPATPTACSCL
jgi:hypothetical protein